jgi:hypothetical protein
MRELRQLHVPGQCWTWHFDMTQLVPVTFTGLARHGAEPFVVRGVFKDTCYVMLSMFADHDNAFD